MKLKKRNKRKEKKNSIKILHSLLLHLAFSVHSQNQQQIWFEFYKKTTVLTIETFHFPNTKPWIVIHRFF